MEFHGNFKMRIATFNFFAYSCGKNWKAFVFWLENLQMYSTQRIDEFVTWCQMLEERTNVFVSFSSSWSSIRGILFADTRPGLTLLHHNYPQLGVYSLVLCFHNKMQSQRQRLRPWWQDRVVLQPPHSRLYHLSKAFRLLNICILKESLCRTLVLSQF